MKVSALAPAMGAEVTNVDLSAAHDDGLIAELRAVWLEYQIIVIRWKIGTTSGLNIKTHNIYD
ncbi:TauD/TfdA family dioxygenase [Alphaproteobacteria bacterium]|nr:TauD/TfdA family dioxygenase [Alphaproteobacteria bacterium]